MASVTGVCSTEERVALLPKAQSVLQFKAYVKPARGDGYIAGTYPLGLTQVDGAPTKATVRILHRPLSDDFADGVVVAEVESAADGTYLVEGLDPARKYDVVGRKAGFNDVIVANVSPKVD